MLERFGIEGSDYRNLLVVAAVVALITVLVSDNPIAVRLVVGVVSGLISAVSFLVVTIVINVFKPDYW